MTARYIGHRFLGARLVPMFQVLRGSVPLFAFAQPASTAVSLAGTHPNPRAEE
jgi:hypothetical protein